MRMINIKSSSRVIPMIYAYSTPDIPKHRGWVKIGYTEKQDVNQRIKQQTHTADVDFKLEWKGNASYDDGSGDVFHDSDFHAYLMKNGVERTPGTEWFHVDGKTSRQMFHDFRENRGLLRDKDGVIPYTLRQEQMDAVDQTLTYFKSHYTNSISTHGEVLWNAKPRFGKTLTVYDFVKQMGAENVLIVTNRPAIANSWYSDYEKFMGLASGYRFVSETSSLRGKPLIRTATQFNQEKKEHPHENLKKIEFLSLQDLKGSIYGGGKHDKLQHIFYQDWDLLVIDEAHEGVDTSKTNIAFDEIKRKFTIHLSGTPFKQIKNDKFETEAIYNWTYADEQKSKREWDGEGENPYANLPQLNLYTYQMSEIIKDELEQGIDINGEQEEYAFDLNEFFSTKDGKFVYEEAVDKFLDALTMQLKFPFSTPQLRNELKHTFWLLDRVDSAKALALKLKDHPIFSEYEIVLAAGNGKLSEEDEAIDSYNRVKKAIAEHDKTITLSVGQLTTGITVPEWTAVLMLSNVKSPALYMQAAFRSQNPYGYSSGGQYYRKEQAYVFDFDPARTLGIYESFANGLYSQTSDGRGTTDEKMKNIKTLLNFFPVIGEDENGEMIPLDAEKVLSIPKKIKATEVVKRGFMSNFLFQNITNVFSAPKEVIDIIKTFTPVDEPNNVVDIPPETAEELDLDENGDVSLEDDFVIGTAKNVFGEKLYDITDQLEDKVQDIQEQHEKNEKAKDDTLSKLKKEFNKGAVDTLVDAAKKKYGKDMTPADKKRLESKLKADADKKLDMAYGKYSVQEKVLEKEKEKELGAAKTQQQKKQVEKKYEEQKKQNDEAFKETLAATVDQFVEDSSQEIVRTVETSVREREKESIMDEVKDHLRGFTRTIPSFLMAYGDPLIPPTLETFDQIVPPDVFEEVTSITLDQFLFLRDEKDYEDPETHEMKHFDGELFDPIVFNDSVREFMTKKDKLSDYFDEKTKGDIFDYIPPQKTNQIFTPKWVVKKMVDQLEEENPGCFDDPDKTFIDLYMKSGLYPAEIVKRLYQSPKMQELYPNRDDRLEHIFTKQVYGLAPTEIIYQIAKNFVLGFDVNGRLENKHNFRKLDALEYAKNGTLDKKLREIYK